MTQAPGASRSRTGCGSARRSSGRRRRRTHGAGSRGVELGARHPTGAALTAGGRCCSRQGRRWATSRLVTPDAISAHPAIDTVRAERFQPLHHEIDVATVECHTPSDRWDRRRERTRPSAIASLRPKRTRPEVATPRRSSTRPGPQPHRDRSRKPPKGGRRKAGRARRSTARAPRMPPAARRRDRCAW